MIVDERMQRIDSMEEIIIENLGERETLNAIQRALSYDDKEEIYNYIFRIYDLEDETGESRYYPEVYM